ncbi:uncharacterized protein LOC111630723 [Centruroides sculpturatus]|uniref:uncharacterized protein LOC111630723 n=1 Tax=Centruroides sculpturatus TaxID=218467 RepID=UPI000C6CB6C1|nr:uncharacterized protein LOC111630723 [Centruroides sculpturatus]
MYKNKLEVRKMTWISAKQEINVEEGIYLLLKLQASSNSKLKVLLEHLGRMQAWIENIDTALVDGDTRLSPLEPIEKKAVKNAKSNTEIDKICNKLHKKLMKLEDKERTTFLILGLEDNDKMDDCSVKVQKLLNNNLKISAVNIKHAFRVGKFKPKTKKTVTCELFNFEDKLKIHKNISNLKDSNIFINDDYLRNTRLIRNKLMLYGKEMHLKEAKFVKL